MSRFTKKGRRRLRLLVGLVPVVLVVVVLLVLLDTPAAPLADGIERQAAISEISGQPAQDGTAARPTAATSVGTPIPMPDEGDPSEAPPDSSTAKPGSPPKEPVPPSGGPAPGATAPPLEPRQPSAEPAAAGSAVVGVDVIVYSTQTSGLAAAGELLAAAPHLRVALISSGNLLETPLAQGLSVEDARDIGRISGGFYEDWRQAVIDSYRKRGLSPFTASGRFVYEPEVAAEALWALLKARDRGNLFFYSAHLVGARDDREPRYADLVVEGQGPLRVTTRFFIDASVEADLARALGADYRIGRHEDLYNDLAGRRPAYPSPANNFETAPQRYSPLLTLKVYPAGTNAPRIADFVHPNYRPSTYASMAPLVQRHVDNFRTSWSMTIATLPNSKRELNEIWSDWPDVGLSFQWVYAPEKRGEMRARVLEWVINRVRYVQENGYPRVGIATVPQKLYVREGPRVLGLDTYTVQDLRSGVRRDPVALGCYCEYDRHDAFHPNHIEATAYVRMPMGALLARHHPWLLVSTAVSVDFRAYSSAVRMEHTRAAMGGAAALIVALADRSGVNPQQVPYSDVRARLLERGYRVEVGQ